MIRPAAAPNPQPAARPQERGANPSRLPSRDGAHQNLPPSARPANDNHPSGNDDAPSQKQQRSAAAKSIRKFGFAAAALLGLVGWWSWGSSESSQREWINHEQANSHWSATQDNDFVDQEPMKFVSKAGKAEFSPYIPLSAADDVDTELTDDIQQALASRDDAEAQRLLRDAQTDLVDANTLDVEIEDGVAEPSLEPGMQFALSNGQAKMYQIFLYDSCYQDGDIVDIFLNGHRFATVPITNMGTTLSVPVTAQGMKIQVLGVHDGGGGITVACQTSHGEGFIRVMAPGEVQDLAFVVR